MEQTSCNPAVRVPWNKGKIVGQRTPLKLKEIWAIRVRLQLAERRRELALFNLAIISLKRAGPVAQVAQAYLCATTNAFLTRQTLVVDKGLGLLA
jgi:hypothetical protein